MVGPTTRAPVGPEGVNTPEDARVLEDDGAERAVEAVVAAGDESGDTPGAAGAGPEPIAFNACGLAVPSCGPIREDQPLGSPGYEASSVSC